MEGDRKESISLLKFVTLISLIFIIWKEQFTKNTIYEKSITSSYVNSVTIRFFVTFFSMITFYFDKKVLGNYILL